MQGGEAPVQSVGFWKEQCQSLFDVCKKLKEDNEKLVDHLGVAEPSHNTHASADLEAHPLDQFSSNQELLNYLNSKAPQLASGQRAPGHQRNRSQQAYPQ